MCGRGLVDEIEDEVGSIEWGRMGKDEDSRVHDWLRREHPSIARLQHGAQQPEISVWYRGLQVVVTCQFEVQRQGTHI